MAKRKPRTHDETIELIITVGALLIAAGCMVWLGFLIPPRVRHGLKDLTVNWRKE